MSGGPSFQANKDALFSKGGGGASVPRSTFTTVTSVGGSRDKDKDTPKRINFEKLKEAEDYRNKAKKALKMSVFGNWKPDHLQAGPYFERAASLFKAAGAPDQAKDMFIKAADCNEKCSLYSAAASAYKNAGALAKEATDDEDAAKLYAKEAEMWAEGGDVGRAADSYLRAATTIEDTSPDAAVDYVMTAMELLCPQGGEPLEMSKAPQAGDCFSKGLNLCLRNERIPEAIKVTQKAATVLSLHNMTSSMNKMYLTHTILHLYQGDLVAAEKLFQESHIQNNGYLKSSECEVEESLIHAAKDMSPDVLQDVLNSKLSRAYLDQSVVKIARRLTIDRISGIDEFNKSGPSSPTPRSPTSPSSSGLNLSFMSRKPTKSSTSAEVPVDPSMELPEEEKARIRDNPMVKKSSSGSRAPAPAPAQPRRPAYEVDALVTPTTDGVEPSPASNTDMFDLSDLQAGLEDSTPGDGEEEEDLDAVIAAAQRESALSSASLYDDTHTHASTHTHTTHTHTLTHTGVSPRTPSSSITSASEHSLALPPPPPSAVGGTHTSPHTLTDAPPTTTATTTMQKPTRRHSLTNTPFEGDVTPPPPASELDEDFDLR